MVAADADGQDAVFGIQGAIALARALDDGGSFDRAVAHLKARLP
jgi:hypothetical protein